MQDKTLLKHSPSFLDLKSRAYLNLHGSWPMLLYAIVGAFAQLQNPPAKVARHADANTKVLIKERENAATLGNGFDCLRVEIVRALPKVGLGFHFSTRVGPR